MKKYDIEKGTLKDCLKYWENPDRINEPITYNAENTLERSELLLELFNEFKVLKNYEIFEIGCNCGRNLNYLRQHGYKFLTGIDINKRALELQNELFPNLKATLIHDSIEHSIPNFYDLQFDVIFTMAVLQHIHIESNWIFDHIARITEGYLFLIELEVRDYKNIFENKGFKLIYSEKCNNTKHFKEYKIFVFKRCSYD